MRKNLLVLRFLILMLVFGHLGHLSAQNGGASLLKIYPNPAQEFFTITDDQNTVNVVMLYNILGKQVKTFKVEDGTRFNIAELPEGIYLVRFIATTGATIRTSRLSKLKPRA